MSVNAVIMILTQNTEVRRTYLKTTLYFLFRFFNDAYRYPVTIMHESDYDLKSQEEIIMSVRKECRDLVSFKAIDPNDFTIPEFIDKNKMNRCINTKPVPYWRNSSYRAMCRWWLVHFHKYCQGYEYVMRIDDDLFIEEPISQDLFKWAKNKDLNYSSALVHVDCGVCCYGMKQFFKETFPTKTELIEKAFINQTMNIRVVQNHFFRTLLSITLDKEGEPYPELPMELPLPMPIMYYNNFFITKVDFWKNDKVQELINKIDRSGNIFYYRWGDAPLQTLIVLLLSDSEKVERAIFRYSKRLQREAFNGDDGKYYSFMPEKYSQTSCITEQQK